LYSGFLSVTVQVMLIGNRKSPEKQSISSKTGKKEQSSKFQIINE